MRTEQMEFDFMSEDGTKSVPKKEGKKCQKYGTKSVPKEEGKKCQK